MERSIFPECSGKLIRSIEQVESAIVIAHRNPDGDALYSSLAMARILTQMGKSVCLVNEGPFLRDDIKVLEPLFSKEVESGFIARRPLVIVLDCSTPDRPGKPFEALMDLPRVVIDHHSSGVPFTESGMSYIVPASPSTTMLVDVVRESLGVALDRTTADYLYRGFVTDTGFYHFLSSEAAPECLRRAAAFTECGISPYEIYDEMHDGRKLSDIKDTARIIAEAEAVLGGQLIIAVQSVDMKDGRLSDGVYASLLETEGVKAVILIKDKGDAMEIGFRSKNRSGLDVGAIAARLGGGGHSKAAGASVKDMKLDQVKTMLIAMMEEAMAAE